MKTMRCPIDGCGDEFDVDDTEGEELVAIMPVGPQGRPVGISDKPVRHEHQIRYPDGKS